MTEVEPPDHAAVIRVAHAGPRAGQATRLGAISLIARHLDGGDT